MYDHEIIFEFACTSVFQLNSIPHTWRPQSLSRRSIPYFSCLCNWDVLFYLLAIDQGLDDWWTNIRYSLPICQVPLFRTSKFHVHTYTKIKTHKKANNIFNLLPTLKRVCEMVKTQTINANWLECCKKVQFKR